MNDSDIKLLIHCNGTDGSTTFTDESLFEHSVSVTGNAQIDTAQKKFGTASGLFDGNADRLVISNSTDWDLMTSTNYTIDLWVRTSTDRNSGIILHEQDSTHSWEITQGSVNHLSFHLYYAGYIFRIYAVADITDGNWHHICGVKVGTSFGLYLDGIQVGYDTSSSTQTLSGSLRIGQHEQDNAEGLIGNLDEIRIAKVNHFNASPNVGLTDTITVPTSEYAIRRFSKVLNIKKEDLTIDYTKLLLHCDGTDGSTTFIDDSESGHTVTAINNAQVDTTYKKFGTGGALFSSLDDYLSIPDSSDWYFGSSDFTVDVWIKPTGSATRYFIGNDVSTTNTTKGFHVGVDPAHLGVGAIFVGNTHRTVTGTTLLNDGNWHHIAFIRYNNILSLYVDGVSEGTSIDVTGDSVNNTSSILAIGGPGAWSAWRYTGSIDEVRISKGIARWTSNFTPPTAPHTIYTALELSKVLNISKLNIKSVSKIYF